MQIETRASFRKYTVIITSDHMKKTDTGLLRPLYSRNITEI